MKRFVCHSRFLTGSLPHRSANDVAPRNHQAKRGFTLIELSIVLVIIGLIAGGVLVGRDLIHAAKMRKVLHTVEGFETAVYSFLQKYDAIPGDMSNATQIWGVDATGGVCPNNFYTPTPKSATCNGNGDGRVGDFTTGWINQYEWARFWQHLANAEMIPGLYTGTSTSGGLFTYSYCGTSSPVSPLGGDTCWLIRYERNDSLPLGTSVFRTPPVHALRIVTSGEFSHLSLKVMSPADLASLDAKADDGKPGTGWIRSDRSWNPDCHSGNDVGGTQPQNALYVASSHRLLCTPVFHVLK